MERLCSLQCSSPELDLCAVDSLSELPDLPSVFGMLWRFIPVLDPSVSVMVSRDLDSRLTSREQAAVEEWLESGLAFHVMRDNPYHDVEIPGGMWGARMDSGGREVLSMAMLELLQQVGLAGGVSAHITRYLVPGEGLGEGDGPAPTDEVPLARGEGHLLRA